MEIGRPQVRAAGPDFVVGGIFMVGEISQGSKGRNERRVQHPRPSEVESTSGEEN